VFYRLWYQLGRQSVTVEGRAGQCPAGQGPGQARAGQGRAGQGRAPQGPGQGRTGQGRAGIYIYKWSVCIPLKQNVPSSDHTQAICTLDRPYTGHMYPRSTIPQPYVPSSDHTQVICTLVRPYPGHIYPHLIMYPQPSYILILYIFSNLEICLFLILV
jgi:hypothetical protein